MRKLLFLFCFVYSSGALAQVPEPAMLWMKGYGGNKWDNVISNVTKTTDGGFIIGLSTTSDSGTGNIDSLCDGNGTRCVFLKYNSDATHLEWSKCTIEGSYLFPQNDGSFVIGGATTGVPSGWAYRITKQNTAGASLWTKTYGGQAASARLFGMIATSDGGYIMVGETNYSDTDFIVHYGSWMDDDIAVVKVDSNGSKVWAKVIGGTGEDAVAAVIQAPGDGCYILGATSSTDYDCTGNHGNGDIYLARLDRNGSILWHKDIGGSGGENIANAFADGRGGIIIAGASSSTDGDRTHFPSFGCPIWALQVDSNQNILWDKCYGGGGSNCYANSVCKAKDGSIWIAGVSSNPGHEVSTNYGKDDAWFLHTDSIGNFLSAKVLGSSYWDRGTLVYPLSNNAVIAGGYYNTGDGAFPIVNYGGFADAFLTILEPWTTGLSELTAINPTLSIYPNPAFDKTTLFTNGINEVYINDITGRTVYQSTLIDKLELSVSGWPVGVYMAKITSSENVTTIQKFIVQ